MNQSFFPLFSISVGAGDLGEIFLEDTFWLHGEKDICS